MTKLAEIFSLCKGAVARQTHKVISSFLLLLGFVVIFSCSYIPSMSYKIVARDFDYLLTSLHKKTLDPFLPATMQATRRASFIEQILDSKNTLRCDLFMLQVATRKKKCKVESSFNVFDFSGGYSSVAMTSLKKIDGYKFVIHEFFFPTKVIENIFQEKIFPFKTSNGLKSIVIDYAGEQSYKRQKSSQVTHFMAIYSPTGQGDNFFLAYLLESLSFLQKTCKVHKPFRFIFFEHYASIKKYLQLQSMYRTDTFSKLLISIKQNFLVELKSARKIKAVLPLNNKLVLSAKFSKPFSQSLTQALENSICN